VHPEERAQHLADRADLLEQAHQIDRTQQQLAASMATVRAELARLRVVMWPQVEPKDIVYGFRTTRVTGPPPIPPIAPNAIPLRGKALRFASLAVLARTDNDMSLTEIHRELHLDGFAIAARHPVKRLADALGYEALAGRAVRTMRGRYALGILSPAERRRVHRYAPTRRHAHLSATA
jgi:hypothetical protein